MWAEGTHTNQLDTCPPVPHNQLVYIGEHTLFIGLVDHNRHSGFTDGYNGGGDLTELVLKIIFQDLVSGKGVLFSGGNFEEMNPDGPVRVV